LLDGFISRPLRKVIFQAVLRARKTLVLRALLNFSTAKLAISLAASIGPDIDPLLEMARIGAKEFLDENDKRKDLPMRLPTPSFHPSRYNAIYNRH
jgi:hypothetical protein